MLTSLYVENFAIVSRLELDFTDKMSAFTGETGAGKSIMIDALMLALGERADSSVIRADAAKCEIQARFSANINSATHKWLLENDALAKCEKEIILRRIIYPEGRSKSYINDIPFSLQKVKELSATLVDIHGQHQHQTLLNHQTHRQQLDAYAGHQDLLKQTQKYYQEYAEITEKIQSLDLEDEDKEKSALLQYQIDELNQLELIDGEVNSLHNEHKLLHHAKEYIENTQTINNILNNDDGPSIITLLNDCLHYLQNLPTENNNIKTAIELINNAQIQCEEALHEILSFSEKLNLDPERLAIIEARMGELHRVARKYQIDVQQLAFKASELLAAQRKITENKHLKQELLHELNKTHELYNAAAINLRKSRIKYAKNLSQEITDVIRNLGMPKGFVEIEITPQDKMHAHGLDKIEYKVCTNPGMNPDSLAKIISGGELSRISLAIQMITAKRGATPTLFFDEVDVGIGGATAALVGKLLRNLGERLQIFCVTHQPQVAASAHQHFMVSKEIKSGKTYTHIKLLSKQEKIDEIARMLGGLEITEQTTLHAKEMLDM